VSRDGEKRNRKIIITTERIFTVKTKIIRISPPHDGKPTTKSFFFHSTSGGFRQTEYLPTVVNFVFIRGHYR